MAEGMTVAQGSCNPSMEGGSRHLHGCRRRCFCSAGLMHAALGSTWLRNQAVDVLETNKPAGSNRNAVHRGSASHSCDTLSKLPS